MRSRFSIKCKHWMGEPGNDPWMCCRKKTMCPVGGDCSTTSQGLICLPPLMNRELVEGLGVLCKRGNSNAGTSSVMGRIRALP